MPLTFTPGSTDGTEMCVMVSILKVISEQNITATLELMTAGDSLNLGNNVTNISIMQVHV